MSLSTKRDVSCDPRKIETRQRSSSRLNRKHTGSHSRKYSTSTEAKMPKMVILSSSTEKAKLETLYNPNKGSPKVIKGHEDSENSNSKSSSKIPFWGSPDLSSGIEKLFNVMTICYNPKSLIISKNLCNIKNMIHLSNFELNELSSLFLQKYLRDPSFQDTIIKVFCLGMSFLTQSKIIMDYMRMISLQNT
jgi:hypothetical protein